MKWFQIRKAKIDPFFRERFEELGSDIVRAYLTQDPGFTIFHRGRLPLTTAALREPMQLWLKEQYDRMERKETWLITMEVAITVFVAAELIMSIVGFICRNSK
jgi:hypothetical protein